MVLSERFPNMFNPLATYIGTFLEYNNCPDIIRDLLSKLQLIPTTTTISKYMKEWHKSKRIDCGIQEGTALISTIDNGDVLTWQRTAPLRMLEPDVDAKGQVARAASLLLFLQCCTHYNCFTRRVTQADTRF